MDNETRTDGGRLREERRAYWRGHVEGQRVSGLSVKAYCAAHGLKPWQWHYWRKLLVPKPMAGEFVEVRLNRTESLVTILCGMCRIEVRSGFDPDHLRAVVSALGAS